MAKLLHVAFLLATAFAHRHSIDQSYVDVDENGATSSAKVSVSMQASDIEKQLKDLKDHNLNNSGISTWNAGFSQPDTLLNWNLCWECLSGETTFGSGKAVGQHCERIPAEKSGIADPPAEWTQCTKNMLTMMAEWNKQQSFRFALFQEGLTNDNWVPYFREQLGLALPALDFIFLEAEDASGKKASTSLISGYDKQLGIPDAVFAINLSPGAESDCAHSMDVRPAVGLVWQGKGALVNIHNGRYRCDPDKGWIYLMHRLQLAYAHCSSLSEDSEMYQDQAYSFKLDEKDPKCWFSKKHQGAHFSVEDTILKGEIVLGGDTNNAKFKETVGEMENAKQEETKVFGHEFKGQKDNVQQKTCCMDKLESYEKEQASPQQWAKLEIGGEADKAAGLRYGDFVWTKSRVPHYLIAGSSGAEYLYDRPETRTADDMKKLDSALSEDDHFFMSDHDPTLTKL